MQWKGQIYQNTITIKNLTVNHDICHQKVFQGYFLESRMEKWFTDTGKKQTDTNIETSYHGQPYRTIEINLEEQMRFV